MSTPNLFLRPLALGKALRGSLGIAHYIFAFVFLVRLVALFRLSASPVLLPSGSDMQFYDDWAKQILHGHWTDYRAFYGLPLYPFLVALLYGVFGYSPFVPGFFQACLDAGTAALIYKITFRLLTREAPNGSVKSANTWGILAAAGWCFYVPAEAYSVILMPTAGAVFVFWFLVWEIVRREAAPSRLRTFVYGVAIGLAAMGVAAIVFLIPLVAIAIFVRSKQSLASHAAALALLFAGFFAGTAPCWIHNCFVARDPVLLSAHSGINFWLGNNPDATGYPRFPGLRTGQGQMLRDSIEQAEAAAGRPLKRSEVSHYWSAKARNYIAQNFADWLKLLIRKFGNFWNAFEYDDVGVIANLREHRVIFPGVRFGVVAALGLAGAIFSWRQFPASRWIVGAVALQVAAILPVFVTERYRLAVVPGLLILAAIGLERLWICLQRDYRGAALNLAAIGATAWFVTIPRHDASLWALEAYNSGRLALELNDLRSAERDLLRAHALVPDNPETNFALGNLRLAQSDSAAAKIFYEAALKADGKHKGALNNLGVVALNEHQPGTAAEYFRRSLELEPRNAKTHYLLAKALLAGGDAVAAAAALQRAIQLDGERPEFSELAQEIERARK